MGGAITAMIHNKREVCFELNNNNKKYVLTQSFFLDYIFEARDWFQYLMRNSKASLNLF